MIAALKKAYYVTTYLLSWWWFFSVGFLLNLGSLPLLLLPRSESRGRRMRTVIRRLFALWVWWFNACGVVRVRWLGFNEPLPTGCIYIANHPTLVDAPILLARLPDTICIFKPALLRNPVIGPPAIMAGYVAGESGVDLVREIAGEIAQGKSLLVFPEGTRTGAGLTLGPVKPGFALIAARAHAPVQLLIIRSTPDLVTRGRSWWRPPAIQPSTIEITLDRRWEYDPDNTPAQLSKEVELHLLKVLRSGAV
ncbi:MAG: 1-acyl-sn-glycerol-3-phosphate acyltransferase [Verrucomicrobia bacterium]|nr:1-acyl-sn-glycerol-3-phosphate acyltransferase [Verrucomicrobiota bacterium]